MKFRILYFGRGPGWLDEAIREYSKQMPELVLMQIRDNPTKSRFERMLRACGESTYRVMLDQLGRQLTSIELAERYQSWRQAAKDVCFLIGDTNGFDDEQRNQADLLWSLSSLTLPYAIARLVVCEQLFRARAIVNRHPYHRT